jgi:hypothetical protein
MPAACHPHRTWGPPLGGPARRPHDPAIVRRPVLYARTPARQKTFPSPGQVLTSRSAAGHSTAGKDCEGGNSCRAARRTPSLPLDRGRPRLHGVVPASGPAAMTATCRAGLAISSTNAAATASIAILREAVASDRSARQAEGSGSGDANANRGAVQDECCQ